MTKERQLKLICGHCDCKDCPIGLDNTLCTLAQLWYKEERICNILDDIERRIHEARENKEPGRRKDN